MALPRQRVSPDAFRYAGVGLTFAATIVLFAAGGFFLDRRLGTTPLFLVLLVFVGFGLGLYSMVSKIPISRRPKGSAGTGDDATSEPEDSPR